MPGSLRIEARGEVALLTLANPAKRNALDPPLLGALAEALTRLAGDGARAAVLTAEGTVFSSGFDVDALPLAGQTPGEDPLAPAFAALTEGALPVVAALNGRAIGGGAELAATCDLRVAHEGVSFLMPPTRLGLVYPPRGLRRFSALIGDSRTRELFLTAAPIEAARAHGWGLIDRLVAPEAVLPTALELAAQIARGAPLAVQGIRRTLTALAAPLDPVLEAELRALADQAWRSEDAAEARRAFAEKRPPRFSGR